MTGSKPSVARGRAPRPWDARFPDETVAVERRRLHAAVWVVAGASALTGVAAVGGVVATSPRPSVAVLGAVPPLAAALAIAALAVLAIACAAIMAARRSFAAGAVALAAAAAQGVVFAATAAWLGAAVQAGAVVALVGALRGLRRLDRLVADESARNPLVASHRLLVRLLARVAVVDGALDRREASAIARVCDSARVSPAVRARFLDEAIAAARAGEIDLAAAVAAYGAHARDHGLPNAPRSAFMAALAVAVADGVIGADEEEELVALGLALGLGDGEAAAEIAAHRASLTELTVERARALLDLPDEWTAEELDDAYRALRADLREEDFHRLGGGLAAYAGRRRALVDLAYEMLSTLRRRRDRPEFE
jgi:hypothetical protein